MIALHSFFAEAVAVGEIALGEMSGSETEIEVQEIRCTPLGDFAEQGLRLSEDLVAGVIGRLEGGTPGSIQVVMEPEDALVWAQIGSVDDPVERFVALGTAVLEGIATGFSEILERVVSLSDPKLVEDAELATFVKTHAPSDTLVFSAHLRIDVRDETVFAVSHLLVEPKYLAQLLSALSAAVH